MRVKVRIAFAGVGVVENSAQPFRHLGSGFGLRFEHGAHGLADGFHGVLVRLHDAPGGRMVRIEQRGQGNRL